MVSFCERPLSPLIFISIYYLALLNWWPITNNPTTTLKINLILHVLYAATSAAFFFASRLMERQTARILSSFMVHHTFSSSSCIEGLKRSRSLGVDK